MRLLLSEGAELTAHALCAIVGSERPSAVLLIQELEEQNNGPGCCRHREVRMRESLRTVLWLSVENTPRKTQM